MLKVQNWPFWLQLLVILPHAALLSEMVLVWSPKSLRGWLTQGACVIYLILFYFIFIRSN